MRFFPKDQDLEGLIKKAEDFDQTCMMNLMSWKPKTCYYHFWIPEPHDWRIHGRKKTTFCVLPCSPCVVSFPKFLEQSNSEAMISAWLFDVGKRTSATCHVFTVFLPKFKDGRYESIDISKDWNPKAFAQLPQFLSTTIHFMSILSNIKN